MAWHSADSADSADSAKAELRCASEAAEELELEQDGSPASSTTASYDPTIFQSRGARVAVRKGNAGNDKGRARTAEGKRHRPLR